MGAAAVTITPILGLGRNAWGSPGGGGNPGKFMVVINLIGGNDSLNMVAPITAPSYVSLRPNINLVTNLPGGETLQMLNANHALHYKMSGIRQLWDDGDVHVVGKVSYPSPNQSHFTSRDIYSFGVRDYVQDGDGNGWLGRFADCYWSTPQNPLGVISVGISKQPDFRSSVTSPLILGNVAGFQVEQDTSSTAFRGDSELREQVIRDILATDAPPANDPALRIFNTMNETYPLVDQVAADTAGWVDPGTYPTHNIGTYLKTISQLLYAQGTWGTQVFYTGFGGFDTHAGQHSGTGGQNLHEVLMQRLDEAVTAFADDMKAKGKWNDAVLVVISEFGRRNYENGSTGTDHGNGGISLVMGGAVKGQFVAGGMTTPVVEADISGPNYLPFATDFRNMYGNIIENHIGLSATPLFPDPAWTPGFGTVDLI